MPKDAVKYIAVIFAVILSILYFFWVTKTDTEIKKHLQGDAKDFYGGFTWKQTAGTVFAFCAVLFLTYRFTQGAPDSKLLALHPRDFVSIPAIFLFNFFHTNAGHLANNLLLFLFVGTLIIKLEGSRGIFGILLGCILAGAAVWLFGGGRTVGFSGAVFACWGMLLVRTIRTSILQTIILLMLIGTVFELPFFETIRPTKTTESQHISWLGHLGGLIGGMMAQIRSRAAALELLFRDNKLTAWEFAEIAKRIHKEENIAKDDDVEEDEESDGAGDEVETSEESGSEKKETKTNEESRQSA